MDIYWKTPTSGYWSVGSNWTNLWSGADVLPGVDDVAHLNASVPNAYTVTLNGNVSIGALSSQAALNLAGYSMTLANASATSGNLDLTGSSLLGAGTLSASGATTLHGTTLGTGGLLTLSGAATILDSNTLNRDILATGTTLFRQVDSATGSQYVNGTGNFTNAGTFLVDSGNNNSLHWFSAFTNTGVLNTQGSGYVNFNSFANSGTVNWTAGLGTLGGDTFRNTGTVVASNGSALSIAEAHNDDTGGTIRADGASVFMSGAWTTKGLGTLQTANGGTIAFAGTDDNTGATLDLAGIGITSYNYAKVVGGNVTHSDTFLGYDQIAYDGATLDRGLNLSNSSITLQNGAKLGAGTVNLGNGSTLTLKDSATTLGNTITNSGSGYGTVQGVGLTLGAGSKVLAEPSTSGYGGLRFVASGNFQNLGAVQVDPNGWLSVSATSGSLQNAGSVGVSAGGYATLRGASFDNSAGTIGLNGGTLDFGGNATLAGIGSMTGVNGSKIRYGSGTLALGGGTLDLARFGGDTAFGVFGGTIANGSIANSDRLDPASNGYLSGNIALDKGLRLAGGYLSSTGSLDLGQGGLTLTTASYQSSTLQVAGDVKFGGAANLTGSNFGAGTVTNLKQATLSSGNLTVNNGGVALDSLSLSLNSHLLANAPSTIGSIASGGGAYTDNAVTAPGLTVGNVSIATGTTLELSTAGHGATQIDGDLLVDGTLARSSGYLDTVTLNGGTLSGNGYVYDVALHGATFAPGDAGIGRIGVGSLSFDATSRFLLEIGGDASTGLFDSLNNDYAFGTIALDGTLQVALANGYTPTSAQTWRFIDAEFANRLTGTFSVLNLGSGWSYGQDATGAFVAFTPGPVPEPASVGAIGLGLLAFVRRRRKA